MKTAKVSDIVGIVNKIAPPLLAEPWDNSGLQLGNPAADVQKIMVALEPTISAVISAIEASCQILLTHHPLIFKPQSSIIASTPLGKTILTACAAGLNIISMHTNYDSAPEGLNDLLASMVGVHDCTPLTVSFRQELVKLVVFVPETHLDKLRCELFVFANAIGDYKDCSFTTKGDGTFTPGITANPFMGKTGVCEKVAEERLELLIDKSILPKALSRIKAVHPYEEPAYDIYPLLNQGKLYGLGRIGTLNEPVQLKQYAKEVADILCTKTLRFVGNPHTMIKKVALCSGSGVSLMKDALRQGADLLLTGDVKYHEARDAEALGLSLIDAGHFGTEIIMAEAVKQRLKENLVAFGYKECEVVVCPDEADPFRLAE